MSTFGGHSCLMNHYVLWAAVVEGVWSLVVSKSQEIPILILPHLCFAIFLKLM